MPFQTLADVLRRRSRDDAHRLAFADDRESVSFAELLRRAEVRAGALREAGVRAGDRVAIAMTPGVPLVETFFSTQLLAAAPCVLNPAAPAPALAQRIKLVSPRATVTDSGIRSALGGAPHDEPVAFLQLTSGTTGDPRASVILQRNVLSFLSTCRGAARLGPDDVFVCWIPPWHDLGLVRFVIAPVYHGGQCHFIAPAVRTIPQWMRTLRDVGATYTAAPDFALRMAVRMVERGTLSLRALPWFTCGGEPVRASTLERFAAHFDCRLDALTPGYGLGEAVVGVSEHLPGELPNVDVHGNVSCGPVNPGLKGWAGRSPEEPGEIRVCGEAVFSGYLGAPEATAHVLRDGRLHTGDSGYLDASGNLYVLGRREGMIKRAGAVVAPRELEEAAQSVPAVGVAAAVSLSEAQHDEEVVVVAVERSRTDGGPTDEVLARHVSRAVLAAMGFAPDRVRIMPSGAIPRTESGKLRHSALRSLLQHAVGPT